MTYVVLALVVNPVLAVAFLVFAVPAYFLLRTAFRLVQRVSILNTENNSILQSHLIQTLNGFKYFKATASTRGIWRAISASIDRQGHLLYAQRRLESLARNGIDLLTVLIIAGLLLYYVEIAGIAFVEMVFMLVILRRTATFAQQTQRSFQRFLEFSGSVRLFQGLDFELSQNNEVFESDAIAPDFDLPITTRQRLLRVPRIVAGPGRRQLGYPSKTQGRVCRRVWRPGRRRLPPLLTGILRPTSGVISIGGCSHTVALDQSKLRDGHRLCYPGERDLQRHCTQ